jgi:hypothetical protein
MKMRTAGQVQRNGFAALAFILAFLAGGAALASDVERQIPSEATVADSASRVGQTETAREDSGRPETTLSSLPPVPKKITVGSVRGFLKRLRASRKEKPVPAVVVAAPEEQLGRTGAAPREAD